MLTSALGLVAGLTVAAVFAAAGVGKLTDRNGTRKAVEEFGAPDLLVRPLALLLPLAELVVAAALLFASTRLAGAAGALALLAVFSTAIAVSLARGRTPDCHCFGQLHSAPASWKTLARNALLAGLGVVAFAEGGPGTFGWIGNLDPAGILALVTGVVVVGLAAGGGLALVSLLRSYGRVLLRLDMVETTLREAGLEIPEDEQTLPELGIDPGSPAPAFAAEDANGTRVSLDDLLEPNLPLVLLFTSPNCGPCRALLPLISTWQTEHRERLTLAVLSGGNRDALRTEAEEHGLDLALFDDGLAVHNAFQANGTPSAVVISADGHIASYVASGSDEIEHLVERALALEEENEQEGLPVGATVPELGLRDLEGRPVSFADSERDTLVLFWNPGCGFCRSMLDDLRAWERGAAPNLRLLVVSSGDTGEIQADGFQSRVALDPGYTAGEAFGAGGTPMAVLVDSEGRVVSGLVAGGAAVMALATAHSAATGEARLAATP
jgi:thiol-disulfide isomerase/thioredoxin